MKKALYLLASLFVGYFTYWVVMVGLMLLILAFGSTFVAWIFGSLTGYFFVDTALRVMGYLFFGDLVIKGLKMIATRIEMLYYGW